MNHLNYNHFFYFWVVAKEGSIKAACSKLHLSQPTVSDQLRQFEESIGASLFDRRARKLVLNADGRRALQFAHRIFSEGEDFFYSFQKGNVHRRRVLKVGLESSISRSLSYQILLPLIKEGSFLLKVREGDLQYIKHEFEIGNIELLLSDAPVIGSQIVNIKVLERRFAAVCSSEFKKSKNLKRRFPENLTGLDFISFAEHTELARLTHSYFKKQKIVPKTIALIEDINLILEATLNHLCFSILPENQITGFLNDKTLVPLGRIQDLRSEIYATFYQTKQSEKFRALISGTNLNASVSLG